MGSTHPRCEPQRSSLLVTGRANRHARAGELLAAAGVRWTRFVVEGEPTVDVARAGTAAALGAGCDLVIGFGGGSALDAAKAIAALVANGGDPLDYLEVVGRGQPLARPSLPFIAIPTTAGTGSEVTKNAVLASPEHGVKASLRSPLMLPSVAILDPDLLVGLPPSVLAAANGGIRFVCIARLVLGELENEPESLFVMCHCRIDFTDNCVFPIIFEPV